jgi:hypothetical protein
MTKLDLSQFKPIPGFSCIKMKRDIQAKIYEETKDMTPAERQEYIRQGAERFREEGRQFRASLKRGETTDKK